MKLLAVIAMTALLSAPVIAKADPPKVVFSEGEFTVDSDKVVVDCEKSTEATISIAIPDGLKVTSTGARWFNVYNVKATEVNDVNMDKLKLSVSGALHGPDKYQAGAVSDCPGGGGGVLELYGTYR